MCLRSHDSPKVQGGGCFQLKFGQWSPTKHSNLCMTKILANACPVHDFEHKICHSFLLKCRISNPVFFNLVQDQMAEKAYSLQLNSPLRRNGQCP